jgi:hypothetical protein
MRQIIVSLQEGDMQLEEYGVYSEQSLDDWKVGGDGRFELIISKEKPTSGTGSVATNENTVSNWMPMHEKARMFQVRIYQSDWESDTSPALHIERIGAEGVSPPPPEPAALADALARTSNWVRKSAIYWNQYTGQAAKHAVPNQVGAPNSPPGGAENIKYGSCHWKLEDDQALVLTCEVPEAQYFGFCIHTPAWLESGDFANRQVSLSGDQLHVDDDGRIRIVVSARDPGVPNWIDNESRRTGLFVYRFVWATTAPAPTGEVVAIDAVRSLMPSGHPVVDGAERRRRLRTRREQLSNRYL